MGFAILATFVLAVVVGLGWLSWYVYRHIPTAEDIRRRWDAGRRLWWGLGRMGGSDDGGRGCGEAGTCEAGGAGGAFEVRYVARPLPEIPSPPSPSLSCENLVDFGEYIEDYFGPRSNPSSESDYQDDFHPLDNSVNQPSHLEQDDFDYLNQRLIDTDRRLDTMGRLLEENHNILGDLREEERERQNQREEQIRTDMVDRTGVDIDQLGRDMYDLLHDLANEPYPMFSRLEREGDQGGHQGGNEVGHQVGNQGGQVGGNQGGQADRQSGSLPGGHQGGNLGGQQGGNQGGHQGQDGAVGGHQGGHQGGQVGGHQGGHQGGQQGGHQGGHQGGGLVGGQVGGHLGGQVGGPQGRPVVPQPQGRPVVPQPQGGQVGGLQGGQAGMPQNQVNNLRRSIRIPKPNRHPDYHYY